jgi:hypothetical protein
MSRLQGRLRECAESCMKLELKIKEKRRENPRLHMHNRRNKLGNFEIRECFKCYNVLYVEVKKREKR